MNVLALDMATKTGWALQSEDLIDKVIYDTLDLSKFNKEQGRRHYEFYLWMMDVLQKDKVDLIIKEKGFFAKAQGKSAKLLYGFHAVAEMVAYRFNIECVELAPATLKKYITGNGRASKEDMIKEIKKLGYDPETDHEADALGLLHYANEELSK